MLRKFLVVSLAVLTLASCKKDKDDSPAYSLSAKVDGTSQAFNTGVTAQKTGDAQTGYIVAITGLGGTASSPFPSFTVYVYSDAAVVAKAYTAANGEAAGAYIAADQSIFTGDSDFTVTISSINDTNVSGTFSGKVEDGSGGLKTISEGAFSAKFQ
ncbi:MAG TPA: hypothetical protein VFD56_13505 [Chitinophagaceae bacterium]|nr:hypothetical protein [Chitinophagaceae bacterium]